MQTSNADIENTVAQIISCLDTGSQIPPLSASTHLDLKTAYRINAATFAARRNQGWTKVGRKIGFTNRTIWPAYGVEQPMWSYVYDQTLHDLATCTQPFAMDHMPEPRIEPEIVFGLAARPRPDMNDEEILKCIDWLALGFEIVQSIYPGWKFTLADTVAAAGLHAALLTGEKHKAIAIDDLPRALETFTIELCRNGEIIDEGRATNVLNGPLHALRHAAAVIECDPDADALSAGEIVTTGTLTDAFPVLPGQTWSTRINGVAVQDITVQIA